MRTSEYQAEFKDNFFLSKLNHTHTTSNLLRNQSRITIGRSMWTNKIKRRKIIGLKDKSNENSFRKTFFDEDIQQRQNNIGFATNRPCSLNYHKSKELTCRKVVSSSSTQRNSIKLDTHFYASRNFYPQLGNCTPEKTTILQQKIDCEFEKQNCQLPADPRYFRKNQKIKNNINIYKGNFSKFTKKVTNQSTQLKKRHITSDSSVSPWEITEKPSNYYL